MSPIQAGSVEKIEAVDLAKKVSSVSCLYGINFIWSVRQGVLTKKNCISIRQAQRSEDGGKTYLYFRCSLGK